MSNCDIKSNSDLVEVLEYIWCSGHGREASQDLRDGVILEQFFDNNIKAYGTKTPEGWDVSEQVPSEMPALRIFYYGDFCRRLWDVANIKEFADTLLDMVETRGIVFIPLRSPEMLVELGFNGFAERLGLPGK